MNKRNLGTRWETFATEYLEEHDYTILERNYRNRMGEIDIIAMQIVNQTHEIVFVEVKYRSSNSFGSAIEAVGIKKQQTIRKVASYYLMQHHYEYQYRCRFDVIAIDQNELTHIKNAF